MRPRKIRERYLFFRDEWPFQDERILINHHIYIYMAETYQMLGGVNRHLKDLLWLLYYGPDSRWRLVVSRYLGSQDVSWFQIIRKGQGPVWK